MNTKQSWSLILTLSFGVVLLSCSDDPDSPSCDNTFTSADSVCYCTAHPDDLACSKLPLAFTISAVTEERVALTPHAANGTIWCKGFAINNSIYVIDRQSASPHAFWKFNIDGDDLWEPLANFPGTSYGLTGSANGKGYASSYASAEFWEYDPAEDEWTPMPDLPFSTPETHWVEYKGKFYVPANNGIYEFNPTTKEWSKFSEQTSTGFGAIFILGDDMYWWNVNNDVMSRFNLATKTYEQHELPEGFNASVTFHNPFVLGDFAYVIQSHILWIFNPVTRTWSSNEDIIASGGAFTDDVFVIGGKAYLMDDGYLKGFEPAE